MRLPIRARLTLVSGALIGVVLLFIGAFVFLRLQAQLIEAVDAGLRSRADVLLSRIGEGGPMGGGALVEGDEAFAQLIDADGRVIETSIGLPDEPLIAPGEVKGSTSLGREVATDEEAMPARLLAVPIPDGGTLVVGASLEDQRDALALLLAQLLIAGPVAVALAMAVGWLVGGAALRPVEQLRLEAEAVSGTEPGRRLAVPGTGDELARLGESLNRMLDRVDESVARERRFVGDASHELRTPLANLKAELELALRRSRGPDELLAALRSAAVETDRLIRLSEDLLVLARVDGGRLPVRRERLDLGALVSEEVTAFAAHASDVGVTLTTIADDGITADIDGVRLRQAIGNLIDNAMRHTDRGGRVRVELRREAEGVAIEVADDGPGFDPGFVAHAFEPFSRADTARSREHGGAGLGLAIVRAVGKAHGGSVRAANRPEGGASVVLELPASPTDTHGPLTDRAPG